MSFFGVGNPFSTPVGQKIEQATDGSLPSENWALNMEICDIVNSTADGPKDAIKAIRKRLTQSAGKNYTIVMHTLTVLETCVKNCGKSFHVQACNKEFISELVKLIGPKNDPPTVVQEKVLSLIQCWADAFQNQPDLQGVVQVYTELRTKGVEFPMTDLDAMAPIFTPQRSVPDSGEPMIGSPQRSAMPQTSPSRPNQEQISGTTRVAELIGRLAGESPLTGELLHANDRLNNLLLRHGRFINNRNAATGGATPSAILGAAMGVPGSNAPTSPKKPDDDALIDLSDDVPDIAKLIATNMPNRKVVIAGAAFIFMYLLTEDRKSRKRRWWKTNLYKRRSSLLVELKSQHISGQYKNFTRMSPTDFEYLLTIIAPKISRQDTIMRSAISPQDRLALTLRFLATGDSFTSLQYTFRISKQSMSCIVPEVCEAIIKALKENIKVSFTYFYLFIKITN
ncbi:hypothetical protein HF086_005145 [Spodoptera exigua]|uniref:VHS domain-containing protein n=1 Tax=Spodoptera exigua TaxID=7107 RepID=A0A922MRU3_SPOEX|nr:hypothetical protein HF086_005145 [Spodoptera exigua]